MKRSFLKWVAILSLCLLFTHCSKERKQPPLALAPDFTLKTLDGQEITLSKLKGKVVLLDFWATWCGPCRDTIPHLMQLFKTYQKNGLEVIGMNLDRGDMETVRRFVKSMDIPYPIVQASEEVIKNYEITGLPTMIFIDKKGIVREKIRGFSSTISKQMATRVVELSSENL